MIAQRIEPTLSLMVLTVVLRDRRRHPDGRAGGLEARAPGSTALVMMIAVLGFSVPVFVVGYLLAYVFALQLDWLPVQGFTLDRARASGRSCAA